MALRNGMTIAALCDEYSSRDNGKKPATIRSDNSRIKLHIKPKLGRYRIASITSEQVEDFMNSMRAGSKTKVVGLLGAMFGYAVKKKLCASNPVRGVDKPADAKRDRCLSELEYQQLGLALRGGMVSDIFLLLAVTGFRSGEAKNLRWSECDLERSTVFLSDTKTGKSIRPLSGAAIEIIKRQSENRDAVFVAAAAVHRSQAGSVLLQSLALGSTQIVISVTVNAAIAMMAGSIAAFLKAHPSWALIQRWLMGTVLAGLAVRMAVESRR